MVFGLAKRLVTGSSLSQEISTDRHDTGGASAAKTGRPTGRPQVSPYFKEKTPSRTHLAFTHAG
jgi:hypothetical protein